MSNLIRYIIQDDPEKQMKKKQTNLLFQKQDYQKNICRDDCLIWKKEFGCIKLTPEQTKLLKQCKNLSNCPDNQTLKEICLNNQKAWNIDDNDCKTENPDFTRDIYQLLFEFFNNTQEKENMK